MLPGQTLTLFLGIAAGVFDFQPQCRQFRLLLFPLFRCLLFRQLLLLSQGLISLLQLVTFGGQLLLTFLDAAGTLVKFGGLLSRLFVSLVAQRLERPLVLRELVLLLSQLGLLLGDLSEF